MLAALLMYDGGPQFLPGFGGKFSVPCHVAFPVWQFASLKPVRENSLIREFSSKAVYNTVTTCVVSDHSYC